jgi:Protein of unknown function (DUF2970)
MTTDPDHGATGRGLPLRSATFLQTMQAVGWSFFGVRKGAHHERDQASLNPVHLVIAGIAGALLFVGALLLVVNWVLASGVAA